MIQARIHPGSDFDSAREREPDMDAVAHLVGDERSFDFVDDFFSRRNLDKRQRARRFFQTMQMFVQLKDATIVKAQPFPDSITALNR